MPTVSELITQVADDTGLSAAGGEGAIILRAINRAYRRVAGDCLTLKLSGSVVGTGASAISLATDLPSLAAIDEVFLYDGTDYAPLAHVSVGVVQDGLRTSGSITCYSVSGGTLQLDAPLLATHSLLVRYSARPIPLTIASTEVEIVGIEPMYHEDLLGTLASAYVLEGHEGEEQRASYFRGLHKDAMVEFKRHIVDAKGIELANDRAGATHFHTSAPLDLR